MCCPVDNETLNLMEHGRVRLVKIASIDTPWTNDACRRLLFQHGANLNRTRMRS